MTSIKRHIAVNTILLSASAYSQKFFSFFVFLILVAKLSVHDYGVLVLLFSIPGPAGALMTLGLGTLVKSEIALARGENNFGKVKRLLLGYLKLGVGAFGVVLILSFALKSYLTAHYNIYLARYYAPLVFFLLSQYLLNFILANLESFEEFKKMTIVNIFESFIRLCLLVLAVVFLSIDVRLALIIYAFSKTVAFLLGIVLWRKNAGRLFRVKAPEDSELIPVIKSTGKWVIFNDIKNRFLNNIHPWLIKLFLSTEAIAIFGVASRIYSSIIKSLPISTVLFPLINRNVKKGKIITLVVQKVRKYYFIFSALVISGVWLFADFVLLLFFPQYIASSLLIKLLSFRLLANGMTMGQVSILFAHRRQRFQFLLSLWGTPQRLSLLTVFLYFFELPGLAVAVVLNSLLMALWREIYIRKYLNLLKYRWRDYLAYDSYDKMIVGATLRRMKLARRWVKP